MDEKKEGLAAFVERQVSRRQVLAGGLAAGAAAFAVAAGSRATLAQDASPEPTPAATGDGSFAGVMLQGFSGGYSMNAEHIGLAAWNAKTGGNATFTNVPFTEKPAVLAAMIATADSNWDTIYTSDNFMARFGARILIPVAEWGEVDTDDYYDAAISTFTASDGVLRGLPIHYSGFLSAYNTELFAKIGLDQPPTTWEELIDLTPKFKEQGIIPSIQPWLGEGGIFAAFYFMQMYNSLGKPMFSDDRTQLMFDGEEGLRTFQVIERGLKEGFWDPSYNNTKNEHDTFVLFGQGNVAFIIAGEDSVPEGDMVAKFGRMANPGIDAGTTGTVNGSDGLGLSKFSTRADASKSYLTTQFSQEVCLQVALSPDRYPPTRDSVLNDPAVQEYDADLTPIWAVQSKGGMNRWGAPYDWNPVFDEVLAKMISGELDAAGAHQAAIDGVNKVIQEWLLA